MKKNCYSSGENVVLHLFVKRMTKLTVVIIEDVTFIDLVQNLCQLSLVKVNP